MGLWYKWKGWGMAFNRKRTHNWIVLMWLPGRFPFSQIFRFNGMKAIWNTPLRSNLEYFLNTHFIHISSSTSADPIILIKPYKYNMKYPLTAAFHP